MLRHCRHVGGQKQYIFSLGNKIYFHAKLFHCFSPPTWLPWKPSILYSMSQIQFYKWKWSLSCTVIIIRYNFLWLPSCIQADTSVVKKNWICYIGISMNLFSKYVHTIDSAVLAFHWQDSVQITHKKIKKYKLCLATTAYAIYEFVNRLKSIPIKYQSITINWLILEFDEQSMRQDSVTFHHRFS